MSIGFRALSDADVPFAMRLKDSAGWNQTADDWRRFAALRPAGCFVAEWEGEAAGTVTTIDYGGRFGWIGMLLVAPEVRGRGIGSALLQQALDTLSGCGAALLDATPAGRRVYLPLGFQDVEGLERRVRAASATCLALPTAGEQFDGSVRPLMRDDLPAVSHFDTPAFGAERAQVLAAWFESAPHLGWIVEHAGGIVGYSLGRRGSHADHLGPIVAESFPVAVALLEQSIGAVRDRPVLLDTFLGDTTWLQLLDGLGFSPERSFTRMIAGARRPAPVRQPRYWVAAGPEVG